MQDIGAPGAFARRLGAMLAEPREPGTVEVAVEAGDDALDADGVVHAALQVGLLELALQAAATSAAEPGQALSPLSLTTDLVRAAPPGRLVARARVERRSGLVAFPVAELFDREGRLVARATGMWALRRAPAG